MTRFLKPTEKRILEYVAQTKLNKKEERKLRLELACKDGDPSATRMVKDGGKIRLVGPWIFSSLLP
tara:strand:+ start:486 stop:683 length:198 start_codon:yes stop_codon:yes gene_type:complete